MPTRKRAQRNWTFMVVPHDSGVTRAVRVPNLVVRTLLGIGGVMLLTIVVLGVAAIARGVNLTRYRGLEHTNRLLVEEIRHERGSLTVLRDSLVAAGQRGQSLRLLAGLVLVHFGGKALTLRPA